MTDDEYTPLIDREREPKSRVHEELTRPARERLATILRFPEDKEIEDALELLISKVGVAPVSEAIPDDIASGKSLRSAHHSLFYNGETEHILTYCEFLFIEYQKGIFGAIDDPMLSERPIEAEEEPKPPLRGKFQEIREVLITEGILWEVEWAGEGGVIQFTRIESDAMADVDSRIQALSEDEPWDEALKGYNDAFDRYLRGDFDELIPKKLYNSIEEVLKTICVDEEEWTDSRDMVHSAYLDLLKEHEVYDAHGVTTPELGSLLDSLDKMVAKVADDRKQRHVYHDRAYSTLLIHQVGAYLYFLISRYEEFDEG